VRAYLKKKAEVKKWLGGMAQVVERLPSKCEALGSNLSTTKKKKNSNWIVDINVRFNITEVLDRNILGIICYLALDDDSDFFR
jgi:hypothetical protein